MVAFGESCVFVVFNFDVFPFSEATGLGFVCFVVFNPRVLSANRVDLGSFCFINVPTPSPPYFIRIRAAPRRLIWTRLEGVCSPSREVWKSARDMPFRASVSVQKTWKISVFIENLLRIYRYLSRINREFGVETQGEALIPFSVASYKPPFHLHFLCKLYISICFIFVFVQALY